MNSRADSRDGGFQVPPEKQVQQKFQFMGSWIPITPTKPVQDTSSLITDERVRCLEGGAGGYTERALYSNGDVQDLNQTEKWMNRNEGYYLNADSGMARRSRLINCIAGSYAQTSNSNEKANIFAGGNVAPPLPPVTRNPIGNLDTANGNPTQYSGVINSCFPEIGNSQAGPREFELDELLFSDQIPYSFSSLLSDGDHLCQGLQYGTPASNQPLYNLNSPPRGEANGSTFSATTLKLVPTTNQANNIENGSTHGPNFLTCDNSVQENGFLEKRVTTTRQGITQQNSDSNIQNVGDFSVVDSTTTKEQRDRSRQNDQVIGLKGTPQLKPLKRKKYMPKVVKENKPQKKAWKPATPANAKPKETGTSRRKRARKTSLKESDTARQTSNSNPEVSAKSCRRALAFDLEKSGDARQDHAEILQKVGGSNSVSETRVTTTRTISSCMDSVTQIDQNVQLLTPNQSFGLSTGTQHAGLSGGDKPSALPTGERQPELTNGNQPARLLARDEQPKILIGTQQHRFLIGRRKCDFPVANRQTQFSTEYRQPHFPTGIQPLGLPVGMQRSFLPMGNQQPRLLMGNQQSPLLMGNMQPGYLIENQHSGYLAGNGQPGFLNWKNQQACLATANQQSGLSIGMQQPGLPTGGLQPGLQMKNQQPGIQMRNQQPELLMKNQQPGSYMRNQLPGLPVMNRMPGNPGGFTSHLNKMVAAYLPSSGTRAHGSLSQTSATNLHAEILKTVSRKLSARTAGTCHRSSSNEYGFSQQRIPQESSYMQYQNKCNGEPLDELRKAVPQNIQRSTPSILSKPFESRGTKRECNHATGQMQNHDLDRTDNWSLPQQIAQSQDLARGNIHIGAALLESSKKMKIQKEFPVNMDGVPYEVMEVKDDPNDDSQKDINNVSINEIALKGKPCPFQISVNNGKCIITPPKPPRMAPAVGNQLVAPLAHASEAQSSESAQTKTSSSRSKAQAKQKSLQHSGKTRGELLSQDPVADMICGLQNLSIGGETIDQMEQNSLVLYRGDGAVIPYEIKKRKPRPKVDLDEETTRIWDLLMGKGGNEGEQQMDKEKEKWWEEERRVLRGRVDSFIARMHLVQGDRRFSPWKGSVVDSVIGVFLTQNVTDHVSSSAFMSLAAIFPPKAHRNQADERNRPRVIVEDPEGFILNLNDIPAWQEQVIDHPCDTQASGVDNGSKDQQKDSSNSGADRISFLGNCSQNLENETLSSQDSFDPATFQSSGGVRSCSGSTSDVEFSTTRRELKSVSGSTKSVQIGKSTLLDDFYCQGHGRYLVYEGSDNILVETENIFLQKPRTERLNNGKDSLPFCHSSNHVNCHKQVLTNPSSSYQKNPILQQQELEIEDFGIHGERNGCSWLSIAPRIEKGRNQNEPFSAMRQAGNVALQTTGQKGTSMPRETPELGLHTFPGKHLDCQLCDTQQNEMNKASQSQSTFTDLLNSSGECLTRHSSATQHMTDALLLDTKNAEEVVGPFHRKASLENRKAKSNSRNREHLTIQYRETNSNNVRERKEKLDYGTIHWDSLRKDVEANGKTRQRSKDAMDSLDYEALRCASVGEISEAIKERGMNNMLARRIKALLDRLVKDHGSIDLEWLRDVPPDKAKDYLLSIRGLGLKSVECVRLLTLHNLAFPTQMLEGLQLGSGGSLSNLCLSHFSCTSWNCTQCLSPSKNIFGQDSANLISEHCMNYTTS
ncbi:PREDICTED: transcriptional activator DEMETER-like isoform X2 [Tarenaya hassleriana]|uniref:transcriptional activator DEMETER-like isoform X2 n=1 Tax=Tarenaya hassleriana TaxID=28532 RepID=UPI00053C6DE7|nr:PREDICTED: transcriptional activator DEMETER-like isoform X2 [Tarenaya hassleriana]